MTKNELINEVYGAIEGAVDRYTISDVIDQTFDTIVTMLQEEAADAEDKAGKFLYPGFGTFALKERAARTGRNPKTGEELEIAASNVITFKPAAAFKNKLG
ncbi:HU family DNA-binding protein [Myxococcota bacterium]|nr:HU family DNA-binding protein [Myxococcota bacterium]MBU1431889.1 HU family DNA-binding protein [Myxococcota bacterium]MBU1896959.1 HU family DNA-binding protein [Myxococcota bacterium]